MSSFIKKGPNAKLLKAEKTKALAGFIRGIQRIGVLAASLICLLPVRPTQVILAATKKMQNTQMK